MRLAPLTWPRLRVTLATLAVALVVAAPAVAQTAEFILEPVGPTGFDVDLDSPTFTLKVRLLGAPGQPIAGTGVDWTVTRGTSRVTPTAASSVTNSLGETTATFTATAAGTIEIRAVAERGSNTVVFRLEAVSLAPPPPPEPEEPVVGSLERVTESPVALVLGDRRTFQVRVFDQNGDPLAGVALTWTVEASPGSPRAAASTAPSDSGGYATGTFGFAVAGRTILAASYPGVTPVRWQVDTGSLGSAHSGQPELRIGGRRARRHLRRGLLDADPRADAALRLHDRHHDRPATSAPPRSRS